MAEVDTGGLEKGLFDEAQIHALLKAAMRDMLFYGEARAKARAPRRTGNLLRNITHDGPRISAGRETFVGVIGVRRTAPYARWVEHGTGIFGAMKRPIHPKTGNFLVWRDHLTKRVVFARVVKGQKGQHYMRDAYRELKRVYVPARVQLLKHEIAAAIKDHNRTT